MSASLLIFDTHPIQYRAPVFRELLEQLPQVQVIFFNSRFDGKKWWFQEVDKIPKQEFGVPLSEGYPNRVLETQTLSFLDKVKTLNQALNKEKPQAVLVYGYYQVEHWILRILCAQKKIPLLFVGETFDWRGSFLRKKIKSFLIGYFFNRVAGFVAIGKKTFDYYLQWGVPASKITQAKYCTDVSPFILSDAEARNCREGIRNQLGIPLDAFVLLFVGRLFDRKRPFDLLEIHRKLQLQAPVQTIFVGNGELSESLQLAAKEIPGVHLVGFKNQKEIKNFYYSADLLVVPSDFETWGLVVNEAFGCQLPALVTDQCGVAEDLVMSRKTGEIFPVGDCEAAVEKIRPLLSDRSIVKNWGLNARTLILKNYQPRQFANCILSAFRKATLAEVKESSV
ncbi:MAG: glycosyltransferase family 4 protein [Pseudomonadota bacterium]